MMKQISVLILALTLTMASYSPHAVPEVGFSECTLSQTVTGIKGTEGKFQFYVFKAQSTSEKIHPGADGISCYGTYDSETR